MVRSLALLGLFWPIIMEALVVCCAGFFIWGLLQPAKRRVALKAIWVSVALGGLLSLLLVFLAYL